MKQVQANLFEALYAVEANRTLMVFTIVTVVFVRPQLQKIYQDQTPLSIPPLSC
jgi:hypothetical protein